MIGGPTISRGEVLTLRYFGRSSVSRLYFGRNKCSHFFEIQPSRCYRAEITKKTCFTVNNALLINLVIARIPNLRNSWFSRALSRATIYDCIDLKVVVSTSHSKKKEKITVSYTILSDLRPERWWGFLRYQNPRFRLFGIFCRSCLSRLYFGKNKWPHLLHILPTRCTTAQRTYFTVNITLLINFVSASIDR